MFSIATNIVSILAAFLYPGYQTFKTLANRPGYENQSARWLMYWAVMAIVASWEYSFEFLINWFPFYNEVKTLFLLFLVLPQTQGSTIIYQQFLLPLLTQHEAWIDMELATLHTRGLDVLQNQFQGVLHKVFGNNVMAAGANVQQGPRGTDGLGGAGRPGVPSYPSGTVPGDAGAASPPAVQAVQDLWKQYGPSVMATGASLLRPAGASDPTPRGGQTPVTPPRPNGSSRASSQAGSPPAMQMPSPFVPPAQIPLPRSTSNLGGQ